MSDWNSYSDSKKSPGVRTLEEIKTDMDACKSDIDLWNQRIDEYHESLWDDDAEDPAEELRLQEGLKNAEDTYAQLEQEYESHPDYYAEKYERYSDFMKAANGIVDSAVATVPVIVEGVKAINEEGERRLESDALTQALEDERKAQAALDEYTSSYMGFADMMDQDELDRLSEELQQATAYRQELEAQLRQPIDINSNAMQAMAEAYWQMESATEDLSGIGKVLADTAIEVGQGVAMAPLMILGPGAYTAGVAANAAAKDIYEQTAQGKMAGEAVLSGLGTAGLAVAGGKISDIKNPYGKVTVKQIGEVADSGKKAAKKILNGDISATQVVEAVKSGSEAVKKLLDGSDFKEIKACGEAVIELLKSAGFEASMSTVEYLLDSLEEEIKQDPSAEVSLVEWARNIIANEIIDAFGRGAQSVSDEIDLFWNTLGG